MLASDVGVQTSWLKCAGAVTPSVNAWELLPTEAVMTADVFELTAPTIAVNDAELCPAPTATLAATVTEALFEERFTVTALGAADARVTVQLAVPGAFTGEGAQATLATCTGPVRLNVTVFVTLFSDAVTGMFWLEVTVPAVTVKPALDCPAATVTLAGALSGAAVLTETVVAEPASAVSVTVQELDPLLPIVVGVQVSPISCAEGARFKVNVDALPAVITAV